MGEPVMETDETDPSWMAGLGELVDLADENNNVLGLIEADRARRNFMIMPFMQKLV